MADPLKEHEVVSLTFTVWDAGRQIPIGSTGCVVGVWGGGAAYEVEFVEPFPCVVTLPSGYVRGAT